MFKKHVDVFSKAIYIHARMYKKNKNPRKSLFFFCRVLMCPHSCILNLPKPREHHPEREVGPGAILAGTIIQGIRLAEAKGADMTFNDDQDTSEQGKKVIHQQSILSFFLIFFYIYSFSFNISMIFFDGVL